MSNPISLPGMPPLTCLAALLFAASSSLPAFGVEQHPEPAGSGIVLHIRSQLVELNPVVVRRDGTPVRNLPQSAFTVYENGVPQIIRNFESPASGPAVPAIPQKNPLGQLDWGNASETILVLDALNTPFDELAYARSQIDRYLKAQPVQLAGPTTLIWLDSRGFRALAPLTRDRAALLRALETQKGVLPEALLTNDLLRQFTLSLAAIQQIALSAGGEQGNKEIIWIGRSFPNVDLHTGTQHQIDSLHHAVESTVDELLKARATIYVLDTTPQTNDEEIDERQRLNEDATIAATAKDPFLYGFTFKSFVEQTGGRYFFGRNDLSQQIRESLDRGESSYAISYIPAAPIVDGAYRRIDIRLNDPNLIVQSRAGYYPTEMDAAPERQGELRFDLYEAVNSRMTYTGVRTALQSCTLHPDALQINCSALVSNRSIRYETSPEGASGSVIAVLAVLNRDGISLANSVEEFTLQRSTAAGEAEHAATQLKVSVPFKKGACALRLVVRDSSGRIGTADLSLPTQP